MDLRIGLFILVLVYVGSCLVLPEKVSKIKKQHINGRPKGGFVPKKRVTTLNSAVSSDQYIDAKVDHFDPSNTNTYRQRYWYNNQWYKAGGPVFVYINGEAAGSGDWIAGGSQLTTLAAELGAFTLSLEHRYYGASKVTTNATNMQFLSSRQALADLADFIPAMLTKFQLTGKVISFGGSYAGALAAWSRMLYPNLIFGAVASSGPVQAVVDFTGYLEVVDDVLSSYTLNNINCGDALKQALAQVQTLVGTTNGRQQLFKGFKTCQPLNISNGDLMANFYSSILDSLMGAVQYGYYQQPCATLTNAQLGDPLTRLETLSNNNLFGQSCLDIDYNDMITEIREDNEYFNWLYQTCNEFGYYQTTDSTKDQGFYGSIIPVNWYVQQCAQLYGSNFGNSSVYTNIANTNNHYFGQYGYNGTTVVLPNGLADPWHFLGVLTAPNSLDHAVLIEGASHCADMDADSDQDSAALKVAKQQIRTYVLSWFNK